MSNVLGLLVAPQKEKGVSVELKGLSGVAGDMHSTWGVLHDAGRS